jgi:hypothetical protein
MTDVMQSSVAHANEPDFGVANACQQFVRCGRCGVPDFVLLGININRHDPSMMLVFDFVSNKSRVNFVTPARDFVGSELAFLIGHFIST